MVQSLSPLLISTMKNEGPYILEWVAFHRAIGFSKFLIYTNDCTDGTTDILDRLTALGIVQHEENIVLKRGPHKSALKYAMAHTMTAQSEWIYVADIDEFLNIHIGNGTVQELINALPDADAIPVTWRLFSHDDHVAFRCENILGSFTDAERALENGGHDGRFVKTLFRNTAYVERFGLHIPIIDEDRADACRWSTPDGRPIMSPNSKSRGQFGYEAAQVNHYAVRSLEGYMVKKDRGRANHFRHVLGSDYWQTMCRGGEEDRTIHRHLPAVEREMKELLSDEVLAKLHHDSVTWHQNKVQELRGITEFEALRTELMALSEAKDHHKPAERKPSKAPANALPLSSNALPLSSKAFLEQAKKDQAPADKQDVKTLIDHLRQSVQDLEPLEANLAARALLNDLEDIWANTPKGR